MRNKNWLAALFAFLLGACGGLSDTSDPDTHVLRVYQGTNADGTGVGWTEDLGFDRDAYLASLDHDMWEDTELGQLEQALSGLGGRHGIRSDVAGDAADQRCPVSGFVAPSTHACLLPAVKNFTWRNDMGTGWDISIGTPMANIWSSVRADVGGTGTTHNQATGGGAHNARIEQTLNSACGSNVIGCIAPTYGPVELYLGTKRYRKQTLVNGIYVKLQVDTDCWFNCPPNFITPNSSTAQKTQFAFSVMKHELGHTIGMGHSLLAGSVMNTNEGGGTDTFYKPYHTTEKSHSLNYQP